MRISQISNNVDLSFYLCLISFKEQKSRLFYTETYSQPETSCHDFYWSYFSLVKKIPPVITDGMTW
jgi:hypothetical protein